MSETITESEIIEKVAYTYNTLPDLLCEQYTHKQILYLYKLITKREVKEINIKYRMIRATRAINAPDKYMTLTEDNVKEQSDTDSNYNEKKLAKVGLASDEYDKNYNPNLEVNKSEE